MDPIAPPGGGHSWLKTKLASGFEIARGASNRLGVCMFSLVATLVLPCFPVFIEWVRTADVTNGTKTVTACVLAATYLVSAEHYAYRAVYVLLFLAAVVLNLGVGPGSPTGIESWDGPLLGSTLLFHASERLYWHVVLDRPFPDWAKTATGG